MASWAHGKMFLGRSFLTVWRQSGKTCCPQARHLASTEFGCSSRDKSAASGRPRGKRVGRASGEIPER
jgi:hypothetical protein